MSALDLFDESVPNAAEDEASREAIREQLDTTMLVEAGAGSGKTTLMVDRLLAYIKRGTPVDQLAAVTFTKKAANELRQRLESKMEQRARELTGDDRERFEAALRDRERMFIGTVHAFCGRILREYSFQAGLPPDFTELDEGESTQLRQAAWQSFIEHQANENSVLLTEVANVGIDPFVLFDAFMRREQYRDVVFNAPPRDAPGHDAVRSALHALMQDASGLRAANDSSARDALQKTLDRLWRNYRLSDGWNTAISFAEGTRSLLAATSRNLVLKRWGQSKQAKQSARELVARIDDFVENQLTPWFEAWWAHAYTPVMRLLDAGSKWALQQRLRAGKLGFDDLLTETATLLRTKAEVRRAVGERWRHLLVDEFQDTDPVQAEVCFLIASDVEQGNDWRTVSLRPGSLFVVGDPKQSIYRFRRADLAMYQLVQSRISLCGTVEHLTRNFRSVPAIGALVNAHFATVFHTTEEISAQSPQAPFAKFIAARPAGEKLAAPIARYRIGRAGKENKRELLSEDASVLATWIARRCGPGGDRRPQDFLVLTPHKHELTAYAHELAVRNIPVTVTGASGTVDEVLRELLIVLQALADPSNPIAVIAALEGWCVGCSHVDLWEARQAGLNFDITREPFESESPSGFGLMQLHRWWTASQRLAASTLLERVIDESGLLIVAASSDLGDTSAGRLLQLVASLQGGVGTDISAAIEAIARSLESDETTATLRSLRADAVRLMNLHKAKGLEAPVVVLAAPLEATAHEPKVATWRENGAGFGALRIVDEKGRTLAQPDDWEIRAAEESVRIDAEWDRLRYVAVTRAEEELVVSQRASYTLASGESRHDQSRWAPLRATLEAHAQELHLVSDVPAGRRLLDTTTQELHRQIADAHSRMAQARPPRYELISVTEAAKRTAQQAEQDGAPLHAEGRDAESSRSARAAASMLSSLDPRTAGSLVHAAIEGVLRGRDGKELATYVRALVWHEMPNSADTSIDAIVRNVLAVVDEARQTQAWHALTANGRQPLAELNVANYIVRANTAILTEGVIDAASFADESWSVVDWKLNRSSDDVWNAQLIRYEQQAESYVETLRIRTGGRGTTRIQRLTGA